MNLKSLMAPKTAPTLEEQHAAASATAAAALSVFEVAASDLEAAANTLDLVAAQADAEAGRLLSLVSATEADARQHRASAQAIRAMVGGAR